MPTITLFPFVGYQQYLAYEGKRKRFLAQIQHWSKDQEVKILEMLAGFIETGAIYGLLNDVSIRKLSKGCTKVADIPAWCLLRMMRQNMPWMVKLVLKNMKDHDDKIVLKLRSLKYKIAGTYPMRGGCRFFFA